MVVVTAKEALLWTDGRYFLQAEKELGREWRLMRAGLPGTPEVPAYLKESLPAGSRVGIDPQVRGVRLAPDRGLVCRAAVPAAPPCVSRRGLRAC